MGRSYVVTGGGRGVGRAIVERLLGEEDSVVAVETDPEATVWMEDHPAGSRVIPVVGDASDEAVANRAADLAEEAGTLSGWVNNTAVFRDASLHSAPAREVMDLVALNLGLAVVGCATAVRRFLAAGEGGAIVNVSSHQAQRAVPGALPYVTAKAATEGRADPRARRRLRPFRHPHQRRGTRLCRYRTLRGVSRRTGARHGRPDRGRDAPAAPGRPRRTPG